MGRLKLPPPGRKQGQTGKLTVSPGPVREQLREFDLARRVNVDFDIDPRFALNPRPQLGRNFRCRIAKRPRGHDTGALVVLSQEWNLTDQASGARVGDRLNR